MQSGQLIRQHFDLIPSQGQFSHIPQSYNIKWHLFQLILIDEQLLQSLHPLYATEVSNCILADLQILDVSILGSYSVNGFYLVANRLDLLDVRFLDGSGEETKLTEDFVGKTGIVEADPFFVLLEDFAKSLLDPKLFDLLVLNVDVLLAKRVGYLENYK